MSKNARALVIAEARRLFFQFGFRRVTMDEIASGLKMSKKTLYTLFPAKEDLVRAVVESIMKPNLARIALLIHNKKTVAGFFSGSIAVFHGLSQCISEPMMSDMRAMPEIWGQVERRRLQVLMGLREVLGRGKKSGEIRSDLHLELFLKVFITTVNAIGNPGMMMELNLKPSELADQIYGIFFQGIMTDGHRKRGAE